jgi:hypothetical protein
MPATTGTRECHADGEEEGRPSSHRLFGEKGISFTGPLFLETEFFFGNYKNFRKRPPVHVGRNKTACPELNLSFINESPHAQIIRNNPRIYNSGFKYPFFECDFETF